MSTSSFSATSSRAPSARPADAVLAPGPVAAKWLWAPLIVWMLLIFWESSVPGTDIPGFFDLPFLDKIVHIGLYGVLGFLAARIVGRKTLEGTALITVCVATFALVYGLTDEIHQSFVPNRTFDLQDLGADLLGGALGAWVWLRTLRWTGRPAWL